MATLHICGSAKAGGVVIIAFCHSFSLSFVRLVCEQHNSGTH